MIFSLMITANLKITEITEVLNSMVDFSKFSGIECIQKSNIFLKNEPIIKLDFLSSIFKINNNKYSKEQFGFIIDFSLSTLKKNLKNSRPRILTKSFHLLSNVYLKLYISNI